MRYIDELRKFLVSYPRYKDYGIVPPHGEFVDFTQISMGQFASSDDISQLSLQMTGNNIVRTSKDPSWDMDILGDVSVQRQANFMLQLLQNAGSSGEQADTSEFLLDFTHWIDEQNILRKAPIFGDDPLSERTLASGGGYLADWADNTTAAIYAVQLHKLYTKIYNINEEDY